MDPDPCGGDTDPLDCSKIIETMLKKGGGISNDFFEVWRIVLFSWIRIHKGSGPQPLNTKQLLSNFYVLLVWWGSDRGSAVG